MLTITIRVDLYVALKLPGEIAAVVAVSTSSKPARNRTAFDQGLQCLKIAIINKIFLEMVL